jgi:phenylacetate-coenzyme A ligase PaaK-like adenylate-forming protein
MSDFTRPHLWQGNWISDAELAEKIANLPATIEAALAHPFQVGILLTACEKLSAAIHDRTSSVHKLLAACLREGFHMEEAEREKELAELASFLSHADLEDKLACELGINNPFEFSRPDPRRANFERWAPLGFLVHVAPTNAYSAGAWSVLEGLLSGNVNFLKTGGADELFAQLFLKCLIDADSTATIAPRIIACRISSSKKDLLKGILSRADGVVVWGEEAAISAIKELAPKSARVIEWGPKISFAYFAAESLGDEDALAGLAYEVCRMEQQACSSPQCVYLETEDRAELLAFAARLALKLENVSASIPVKEPGLQEQAEITATVELCRLESCLGLTDLIESKDGSWRILVDHSSVLKASPLFRTIWVKPIARQRLVEVLSPFRFFLQTAGLACGLSSMSELSDALVRAGVLRITRVGKMLDSYSGEPHDGVYALQRYSRRLSIQSAEDLDGVSSFAQLKEPLLKAPAAPIMTKEDYQSQTVAPEYAHLYFRSGGSSGAPKLSIFTYDDYHAQMSAAADGLFAAGLDPARDRCMNLFFGGGLYGGFISFFTILETLKAVQFPMAGHADLSMVAETIVAENCNVLLGMPSYIIQLFKTNEELLSRQKVVKKVFYGGEHFNESQKRYFQKQFGVEIIRSAAYGSVDAGPVGYQCRFCTGSIHHLHSCLHVLEILDLEADKPACAGQAGRVVLTSLARAGQRIERYDIGDVARLIEKPCACMRRGPLFELLGRHGDVFRAGSSFFNYAKFSQILSESFDYAGELQIVLKQYGLAGKDELVLRLFQQGLPRNQEQIQSCLLDNYADLHEMVQVEKLLDLRFEFVEPTQMQRTAGSGKLRRIVDERKLTGEP